MQAVQPCTLPPSGAQYGGLRGGAGGPGGAGGAPGTIPPHARGRTNSLTFTRREALGEEGRGGRREGVRGGVPPPPAPRRGVEEEERRARRGGAGRRLSAPSTRGGAPLQQTDQFVIDHMVNLGG